MVLIVDLKFQCEIVVVFGVGVLVNGMDELSDEDYVGMGVGYVVIVVIFVGIMVECVMQQVLGGMFGCSGDGMVCSSFGGVMNGLFGVVGNSIRGIGDIVCGVFGQFLLQGMVLVGGK